MYSIYLDILELCAVGSGHTEVFPQSGREVGISNLQQVGVRSILVAKQGNRILLCYLVPNLF